MKKNKLEVGDIVYFTNTECSDSNDNGVCVITHFTSKSKLYPYKVDLLQGNKGWLAKEEELRPLTKLERALR